MMKDGFVDRLSPYVPGTRTDEKEPVREYVNHIQSILPRFPRDVIIQWLHRHYESFIDHYRWLDFDRLSFGLQSWPTAQIIATVTAHTCDVIEYRRSILFAEKYRGPLESSMIRRGTWPRPILVLNNVREKSQNISAALSYSGAAGVQVTFVHWQITVQPSRHILCG